MSICRVKTLLTNCLELETAHHRVEEDLQEVQMILVSLLHDLHPLNGDCVFCPIVLCLIDRQLSHLLEGENTETIIDIKLETLLYFVPALLEYFFAHGTGVVRDLGFKLDSVFVNSLNFLLVEFDGEVV